MIAVVICATAHPSIAQPSMAPHPTEDIPVVHTPIPAGLPAGFEGLDQGIVTLFDVYYDQRLLGSFQASLKDGALTFGEPAKVVEALGSRVKPDVVMALLSKPLRSNEQARCLPGQQHGCGVLPTGQSGVIVDPEKFHIDLVLAVEALSAVPPPPRELMNPISGPSFIQQIQFAVSEGTNSGTSAVSANVASANLDSFFSMGRDSLRLQTLADTTSGVSFQQSYAQHIGHDWHALAGVFEVNTTPTIQNYRLLGAEIGSFTGTLLDQNNAAATPIELVIPRQAVVELYRAGVLVSARQYDAGYQVIDTRQLPAGSYPVRIVVRDGSSVILDETRIFTRAADLPPPGKTYWSVRAGQAIEDADLATGSSDTRSLFPSLSSSSIVEASASRRIGKSSGAIVGLLATQHGVYPEFSFQTYQGLFHASASLSGYSPQEYSALLTAEASFRNVEANVTLRSTHTNDEPNQNLDLTVFRPFYRSENDVTAGVSFPLFGGSTSLRASYIQPRFEDATYSYGIQYARELPSIGQTAMRLAVNASYTDSETRVGFTLNFYRRLDPQTFVSGGVGVDSLSRSTGEPDGTSPVVNVAVSRSASKGPIDYTLSGGASTDETQSKVYAEAAASSPLGSVDALAGYQLSRSGGGGPLVYINGQTGFFIGGGVAHFGMTRAGDSVIVADIDTGDQTPEAHSKAADGYYRLTIDDQPVNKLSVGGQVAVGTMSLHQYAVGLVPHGAPPFDIDLTRQTVPLYPGNVVRVRWKAKRTITFFGRLMDSAGQPLVDTSVSAGSDFTSTDDHGYFTLTASRADVVTVHRADGEECQPIALINLLDAKSRRNLTRVGDLICRTIARPSK